MKKFFCVFAAVALLLSDCNLIFAVDFTPYTSESFLNIRDSLSGYGSGIYYDFNTNDVAWCDTDDNPSNPVRGCVRYPVKQEAGDFLTGGGMYDFSAKDVEIRKLVMPADHPGKFNISLLVRGKEKIVDNSSNIRLCSVVVFDKSQSMKTTNNGVSRWDSAKIGAIEFSENMISFNEFSRIGLVFFGTTGDDILPLSHTGFNESNFSGVVFSPRTNIHDGLLHAKSILLGDELNNCDKKYIVLMSDGSTNYYMSGGVETPGSSNNLASNAAIDEATFIKNNGIDIYTISYDMGGNTTGVETMKSIATDTGHYFEASGSYIVSVYNDIFNDIYLNQISTSYAKLTSITDSIGEKFIGDDINITEEVNITSSGILYSFPIRIDPTASGWVKTNDGLTLNYIDVNGVSDSLTIPVSKSSEIYWTQPKCDGTLPEGVGIISGSGEYMQSWEKPTPPQRGQDDEYELYPSYYPRHYTGSSNPGVCEWTCMSGYQLNQQGDGCEEIVVTHEANILVSPAGYGTVDYFDETSVIAFSGANITEIGNAIVIGGTTVVARPSQGDAQYTYEFSGWNNTCGGYLTENCIITAEFKRDVKQYEITFKNYDGTVLQSSPVTYGEMPVYTGTEPTRPDEGTTTYTFEGWNPELTGVTQAQVYTANYRSSLVTHRVSICVDPKYYGTVDGNSFGCSHFNSLFHHGSSIVVDNGNRTVKIGEHTFTAAPNPGDVQYIYEFSGWINTCGDILTYDCSITAEFRRDAKQYEITFKNYDGTVLQSSPVTYGEMPVYTGTEPTRPDGGTTTYTFIGWSPELTGVTQAQVYTANYSSSTGNNTGGGTSSGGGGGGGKLKKDNCPDGDFSGDFYDKKCGSKINTGKTDVKTEEKPAVVAPVANEKPAKKCSIEGSKHSKEVNDAYIWSCENGIIKSNTIQGAKLGEFLNRAEMAKIVTVFEMLVLDSKPNRSKDCSAFADSISGYNTEMKNYMITSCQLERMGIHTADHKPIKDFMPKKFVSRAEFGTILSRILWGNKYEASKNTSKYYVEHLTSLKGDGILTNINPELKERRSYAILMVYRAAKLFGKA